MQDQAWLPAAVALADVPSHCPRYSAVFGFNQTKLYP